ncbi:MAG: phosphotransferase family protein [Proteobacteria bacterium]|nr:phosphotransferase family protein [Pseudomonadota bacterium]
MYENLSPEPIRRLNEAVMTWKSWAPAPTTIPVLTAQLGGDTNLSFLVTDGRNQWVVRLNDDRDSGINRTNELAALTAAHNAGIAPAIIFNGQNILVAEYFSGHSPTLLDIAEIGSRFADIHSLEVSVQPMDLMKHLRAYYQQITKDTDIVNCYKKISALAAPDASTTVLCHQDLTLHNMIRTKDRIVVIDWEYAAMSDPAYDLAVFSYTHELNESQFSLFLDNYYRIEPELPDRVHYFEKIYALIEILWWLTRGKRQDEKIVRLQTLLEMR